VLASDSAATFGTGHTPTIGQQFSTKVYRLADRIAFAGTGAVGMAQLIKDQISLGWAAGRFKNQRSKDELMHNLGVLIGQTVQPYLQSASLARQLGVTPDTSLCKSLLAIDHKGDPCLFQFDYNGAPERATPELPFVALGSGQLIADPFLAFLRRLMWANSRPTVAEGKLVASWTIDHVCKTNPGGVGGAVQMMVLPRGGNVIELGETEADEHKQMAAAAEAALVTYLKTVGGSIAPQPQPQPQPPA
jgi:hypothetical protein